jgi:hypothetical protein
MPTLSDTHGPEGTLFSSGSAPDVSGAGTRESVAMAKFLLHHRHAPSECGVAFAAFRGHGTALRRRSTIGSCALGGHEIWWVVDADTASDALELLPYYVAARADVTEVVEIEFP